MKSKVYFIPFTDPANVAEGARRVQKLLDESRVLDCVKKNATVAVKAHFGEEGNKGFVAPEFAGVICRAVLNKGAKAFLSDTNTLYRGKRTNCQDHLALAHAHGFTKKITGVDVIIPDDTVKKNTVEVTIDRKLVPKAKIARLFADADALVVISHFKGHMLSGFGGALKNMGMGCATREGKLVQHCTATPVVHEEQCIGCGACVQVCPVDAIRLENNKAKVETAKCIGCASCVGACPTWAMFVFSASGDMVQKKMAEYALAVLKGKKGRTAFINFAVKINKECDCWSMENPRIGPDVGILASNDPVSLDKACFDVVRKACARDIFKEHHPEQNSFVQLEYAASLGLGNLAYELVEVEL